MPSQLKHERPAPPPLSASSWAGRGYQAVNDGMLGQLWLKVGREQGRATPVVRFDPVSESAPTVR